jgi:hypothetical protein
MKVAEDSTGVAGPVPATPNLDARRKNHLAGPDKPGDDTGSIKLSPIERAYRRCAIAFLTVFFGGIGLTYAFLLLADPWDTGRFPTPLPGGVSDIERSTATASRARDPRFNAAIVGNSRTYLLEPEKLSNATGYSFVSLGTHAAGPQEETAVTRLFLRFHPAAEALVFGVDERWCDHDPAMPLRNAFPFWLYRGDLEYLAHLLSGRSFHKAKVRIKLALGRIAPTDPRGYFDYESAWIRDFHPPAAPEAPTAAAPVLQPNTYFPAIEMLDGLLAELPRETRFVLMMPPLYYTALPRSGTQEAADLLACKAALANRLGRQGVAFLDYQVDIPINRDPRKFLDNVHYRSSIARVIEEGIIGAFGSRASEEVGGR